MIKLGERIKEARRRKNISQKELAETLKCSPAAIAMWEIGDRKPGLDQMQALSDFFNVSIDYLIGREDVSEMLLDSERLTLIESYNNAGETTREMVRRLLAYSDQLKK